MTSLPLGPRVLPTLVFPVLAIVAGVYVYVDASRRGFELAPLAGVIVGGFLLAGSVPGLVALAIAEDAVVQGFPTAVRVIPGLVALVGYLALR